MRIAFTADEDVNAAIARVGRTEDVQFSPDDLRLVVIAHLANRLLILDVEADLDTFPPRLALTRFLEIDSETFDAPHGVAWIDERTIVIANRNGLIGIFELPIQPPPSAHLTLQPIRTIGANRTELVNSPGSVSIVPVGMGLFELLACNNSADHVTRHLIDQRNGYAVVASEILLNEQLELPDGVTQSHSGQWIAVSNHERNNVLLFRNEGDLGPISKPHGVLSGVAYPHGLQFAPDDSSLLVADAGAPVVHMFSRGDSDWSGERQPVKSIRVLSDAAFKRGNTNPREGGPKGISLTKDGRLMVASCQEQPLAFFDMRGELGETTASALHRDEMSDGERARKVLLRHLNSARSGFEETIGVIHRAGAREVQTMLESRSWRISAPLREVGQALRNVRGFLSRSKR